MGDDRRVRPVSDRVATVTRVNWSREMGRAGRTGSWEMGLARAGLGSGVVEWAARRGVWLGRDDRAARAEEGSAGWARVGREQAARFRLGRRKVGQRVGLPTEFGLVSCFGFSFYFSLSNSNSNSKSS